MPREEITLAGLAGRMFETLDVLKLGVVLASADSCILYANRAAQEMMRDGGPMRNRDGALWAGGEGASAGIRAAIRHAARNHGGIGRVGLTVRLTNEDEAPVVAHVLALAAGEAEAAGVAAVFINPGGR